MANDDRPKRAGIRKDGKPYKPGNTRDDGSYGVGKNRAPTTSRFAKDDGRPRGVRPKGGKNLLTDWREELATKVAVNEGGTTRKITKQRAMVKSQIDRGLKKSDKAAALSFQYAELSEKRDPGLQADDFEIIDAWLGTILGEGDTDDADLDLATPDLADDMPDEDDG